MAEFAKYTFMPFARFGLATRIAAVEGAPNGSLVISTSFNLGPGPDLTLRGPGDVLGIASSQVVRTEPVANAADFEDNYFPFIEFLRPDFPWLLTPLRADDRGRVRPWIVLIVVEDDADVTFTTRADALSILTITSPAAKLPNLAESCYWASVQTAGDYSDLAAALTDNPDGVVSRLVCPRQLKSSTKYRACLVPAFETGRLAGLGQSVENPTSLQPAWEADELEKAASLELPVYYTWTFSTGAGGDFESLARQLKPRTLSAEIGVRQLDGSDPGLLLPAADDDPLQYVGVMKSPAAERAEWTGTTASTFMEKLSELLNRAKTFEDKGGIEDDPVIAPPIYGRWHAAQDEINDETNPPWLVDLNLDPIHRVVAALGTKVIKRHQDALMESAWRQLDEIKQVNRVIVRAQLAREIGRSLKRRHIDTRTDAAARAQLSGPAHARTPFVVESGVTIRGNLRATSLPVGTASPALRRAARPGGSPGRVARTSGRTLAGAGASILRMFDANEVARTQPVSEMLCAQLPSPAGMYTTASFPATVEGSIGCELSILAKVSATTFKSGLSAARAKLETTLSKKEAITAAGPPSKPPADLSKLSKAVEAAPQLEAVRSDFELFQSNVHVQDAAKMDLATVASRIYAGIDPDGAVAERLKSRITGLEAFERADDLDTIMAAPEFPQPMYQYMRDVAADWFVPGLDLVEDDTVSLLQTNPRAIEAFMVGLSHEMARELLWREYPTDQRGTYFRHFWDRSTQYTESTTDVPDIEPIHEWDSTLGDHPDESSASDELIVLLLRGELLRRYPDTIVYATKATYSDTGSKMPDDESPSYPLFSGSLGGDVMFFGFGLIDLEVRSSDTQAGYFFVLQQQTTAPRFGLDAAGTGGGLSWGDVGVVNGHIELGDVSSVSSGWGYNSAHLAQLTLQTPVRIYFHADDMLP